MKTIKVSFDNSNGNTLSARLELPVDRDPHAFAIFAHCFTCNKNLMAVKHISRGLTGNGIAVLRFDFTGLGESEGEFAETNFSSNVEDLLAASRFLSNTYKSPSILVGHSLGGAAVLKAAPMIGSLKAIVTIGAPADPQHVSHLVKSNIDEINKTGEAEVNIGGRNFKIKKQFLDDLKKSELKDTIKSLRNAILIMHSPQDQVVGIENAAKLYENAHHPKSFVSLDGADHLLSNKSDSFYAGELIGTWARRYINIPEISLPQTDKQVVASVSEGFTTEMLVGEHHLVADEPEQVGGNNYGPSPYDYLSAALAACTAMTLRMYADRKKWPLSEVTVHVQHSKDYAEDCENPENTTNKIDRFERIIELEGELIEEQRQRIIEIANKCPVHKTLHSPVEITTQLKS